MSFLETKSSQIDLRVKRRRELQARLNITKHTYVSVRVLSFVETEPLPLPQGLTDFFFWSDQTDTLICVGSVEGLFVVLMKCRPKFQYRYNFPSDLKTGYGQPCEGETSCVQEEGMKCRRETSEISQLSRCLCAEGWFPLGAACLPRKTASVEEISLLETR